MSLESLHLWSDVDLTKDESIFESSELESDLWKNNLRRLATDWINSVLWFSDHVADRLVITDLEEGTIELDFSK